MRRLAFRGLAKRKLRSALTAVAVLLGVAMITGSYIEIDQIRNAFSAIMQQSVSGLDVIVSPEQKFTAAISSEPPTLPAKTVGQVRQVAGVRAAQGELTALGSLVVDGKVVDTFGAPGLVIAKPTPQFNPTESVAGRQPRAPDEAAVLQQNAADHGIEIGDRIGVTTRHGVKPVTVTGIFAFGEGGSSLGGATMVELPRADVQSWFDLRGKVNSVSVLADSGVDTQLLSDRIAAALPGHPKVQTAQQNAQESADQINDSIGSFLTPALLALAGAAILVGAFIIFNTFSITVAQRLREFAMLRALGATRRQILTVVVTEALVIGIVASGVGLAAGVGFSKLLNSLFDAVGFGIPRTGLVLEGRTIAIALGVGIGVTTVASLVPALRATRVSPVVAMSGTTPKPSRRARRISAVAAAAFTALGAAVIAQGLFGSGGSTAKLGATAGGAVLVFIGVALSGRYVVRPLAAVVGWPIERAFHTTGRLARENAERNPGRTAITSAALMVGLGLVVFVAVFAAGLKTSIGSQIDSLVRAELIVYNQSFQAFPARTARIAAHVPGVAAALGTPFDQLKVNGEPSNSSTDVLIGADPRKLTAVYNFDWIHGSDVVLRNMGLGDALIEEQFAKSHHIRVGDTYRVVTPTGGHALLRAVGEYRDPTVLQGSMASIPTLRAISQAREPISLLIATDPGADVDQVQASLKSALKQFPTLKVQNKAEYQQTLNDQLNQIVYLLYALLAFSVVISLFGIANSLFLSIHERTREIALLRAVGATVQQIRRMIRYESVITAVIGGLLGTGLGILFAWLVIQSLSEFGFSISIPVGQLAAFMALTVVVGIVGAIAPARSASKVDLLEAIHND